MSFTRQLQALGAKLDDVLEKLTMPVMLVDASGVVRWQNAASIALVGEKRGVAAVDAVAPEYVHEVQASFARKTLGIDESRDAELVVVTPDGQRRRVQTSTVALRDGSQRVVGVLGFGVVFTDPEPMTEMQLTPRQHETLRLLAQGLSTEEIASSLGVTRETARNYIRRLLRTMGVRSRLEAVVRGGELGLISS
jgi:DNA-binding CsgD family transcriptional regulator